MPMPRATAASCLYRAPGSQAAVMAKPTVASSSARVSRSNCRRCSLRLTPYSAHPRPHRPKKPALTG